MRDLADEQNLTEEDRPLAAALLRGWRRRCPNCGGGSLFKGYLTVRRTCPSCGQPLHHHRADDLPAWATILIVGHVIGPALLFVETTYTPPMWVHWALWPLLAITMVFFLLPRLKGMVVAMQWAWRMHGFSDAGPEEGFLPDEAVADGPSGQGAKARP